MSLSSLRKSSSDHDIGYEIVRAIRNDPSAFWLRMSGAEASILADKLSLAGLRLTTFRVQGRSRQLLRYPEHVEFLVSQESNGIHVELLTDNCRGLAPHDCDCTHHEFRRPDSVRIESLAADKFEFDGMDHQRNHPGENECDMFEVSFGPCGLVSF